MPEFIEAPKSNRFVTPDSLFAVPLAEKPLALKRPIKQFSLETLPSVHGLPWIPFRDERDMSSTFSTHPGEHLRGIELPLPPESGIYFVLSVTDEVLYVGRSINLKRRWRFHQILPALRSYPVPTDIRIAYFLYAEELLSSYEAHFLKMFQPQLNTPWEIAWACQPDSYIPQIVHADETARLGQYQLAADELFQTCTPCAWGGGEHANYLIMCTQCLSCPWCALCLPFRCECWKASRWPMPSPEAIDALYRGIEVWLECGAEHTLRKLDEQCRLVGGNKNQMITFKLCFHWPTIYEAHILARALGTTLEALEEERNRILSKR